MKISEIRPKGNSELSEKVTFILSGETKRALHLIAESKGRTVSAVVREIVDRVLESNQEELAKLG